MQKNAKQFGRRLRLAGAITGAGALILSMTGILNIVSHASAAPQQSLASLGDTINGIIADPRLRGAQVGVLVRSATDGSVLYAHSPTTLFIPASNSKLYSSSAALKVLGPDYRFNTTVATDGQQAGGVIAGNLFIKGSGDPTMQPADYDMLAANIASKGIKLVTGKLVADDSFFDHRQLGFDWEWDSNPFYFQPEISALTVAADAKFDTGSLIVETTPANAVGQPAQIRTIPATNYVTIQNETTTGPAGSANTIAVERKLGINVIVVTGSMPIDGSAEDDISTVTDPTGYAASLFRDALSRHGVTVLGDTSRGITPATASILIKRQSMPLSQLLTPFLKLSNNEIAETLVKTMGEKAQGQGSWGAGLSTELPILSTDLGVDTNGIQFFDGSGLSTADLTTPEQTTNLLLAAQHQSWFSTWYNALPIAGQSDPLVGGTLRSRMVGTSAAGNVHAKTGSLDNVSALSGYVTAADGQRLVFSIMETNYIETFSPKPLEDQIAETLANFSQSSGVHMSFNNTPLRTNAALPTPVSKTSKNSNSLGLECSWTKEGC